MGVTASGSSKAHVQRLGMDCMRVSTGCPARCHLRNERKQTQFNVPTTMQKLSNVWVRFVVPAMSPKMFNNVQAMSRVCCFEVSSGVGISRLVFDPGFRGFCYFRLSFHKSGLC